jgi:hypothetical protein
MKTAENRNVLFEAIVTKLTAEDDREFWQVALGMLADEFLKRYEKEAKNREWVFIVGACSHWVRPHNSSWKTTAGRFVNPGGYQDWSPELDWSVAVIRHGRYWTPVEKLRGKGRMIFRVAIPTRTARHRQAAVNSTWSPGKEIVLYGFRHIDGRWKCVAASDEKLRGRISVT